MVVIANAINLIDGLDGLAAGIVIIAGAAMFLYADRLFKAGLLEGSNMAPLIARDHGRDLRRASCRTTSTRRASSWATPARCSSACCMATTTITIGGRTTDPFSGQTYFYFAPLLIPLVILGVPIVDTAFSFLRRVVKRQSFAQADHEHLHHRLMRMGHGPRRAVVILWLWTALLSAVVLLPTFTNRGNSLVPLAVAALALLLYIYFHPGSRSAGAEAIAAEERGRGRPAARGRARPAPGPGRSTSASRRGSGRPAN